MRREGYTRTSIENFLREIEIGDGKTLIESKYFQHLLNGKLRQLLERMLNSVNPSQLLNLLQKYKKIMEKEESVYKLEGSSRDFMEYSLESFLSILALYPDFAKYLCSNRKLQKDLMTALRLTYKIDL